MGLDGVSRQYRQITGQDKPVDEPKSKAKTKAEPAPVVDEPVVEAEASE